MLVMDMEVPAFVQPVQRKRRRDSKNVWMAREDDTDDCAKARFLEEISAGVLDVLLCHPLLLKRKTGSKMCEWSQKA
ncbi:uncharacterized protein LOC122577444 isoform X5 [Bombus pyrosoma]|uniref:uncharacterized protein LOC122577444 isoform X5 n=1 Tax=Bombus pyrosoma TaxID=396416 RepID=UPI001CB9C198|nr:uncharacterized protein LOC122577444 isoform X5 [Bombus pyrosoma]